MLLSRFPVFNLMFRKGFQGWDKCLEVHLPNKLPNYYSSFVEKIILSSLSGLCASVQNQLTMHYLFLSSVILIRVIWQSEVCLGTSEVKITFVIILRYHLRVLLSFSHKHLVVFLEDRCDSSTNWNRSEIFVNTPNTKRIC